MLRSIILCFVVVTTVYAVLNNNFNKFIAQKYGRHLARDLNRADLGVNGGGSFGGGHSNSRHRPVVLVHGLGSKAGNMGDHRRVFVANGWPHQKVLATSYGPGIVNIATTRQTLHCNYVKQVRNMLQATIAYFKSDIDVLAISMGSPIARKAILGGHCVDTHEYLGGPLTHRIVNFVSVAGVNQGSLLCTIPLPGVCNNNNGLSCRSNFIRDINSRSGYEARYIHSIASTTDEVVGFINTCAVKVHTIAGMTEHVKRGLSHHAVIYKTIQEQVNILKQH